MACWPIWLQSVWCTSFVLPWSFIISIILSFIPLLLFVCAIKSVAFHPSGTGSTLFMSSVYCATIMVLLSFSLLSSLSFTLPSSSPPSLLPSLLCLLFLSISFLVEVICNRRQSRTWRCPALQNQTPLFGRYFF